MYLVWTSFSDLQSSGSTRSVVVLLAVRDTRLLHGFSNLSIYNILQGAYGIPNPDKTDKDISWIIPNEHSSVSKGIVACSYLFVASFATTWGPTSWTYPSEIFPSNIFPSKVAIQVAATIWIIGSIFQAASNGVALL
ncbi:hypothetical protein DM02DRAFT_662329 [Periconia macrospinosa]|uniref:Major facilitator superfamily (MFS) profile domain-containing protein n=1 Tax=Periconia macrospinosa TaxID=97972 RepID=A0A2V1D750_9PLEO|nr:hypothetical protein DM02DRAFT_662329 [Periconia macrospinosa]